MRFCLESLFYLERFKFLETWYLFTKVVAFQVVAEAYKFIKTFSIKVELDPFYGTHLTLCPLKTSVYLRFSDVFRGCTENIHVTYF